MKCPSCASEMPVGAASCPSCGALVPTVDERALRSASPTRSPRRHLDRRPASAADDRLPPGTVLGDRYRIVSIAGRGGMGEIYRAADLKLGVPVALKFLPESLTQDEVRLSLLFHEVRIARQITHPNVCRIHDVGEVEGLHFISMEYVDGEDLATLLRRVGRLPAEKAVEIGLGLCRGLEAAHEQGILHRDLKPANVMIDDRGSTRITDFGLCIYVEATATLAGAEVGCGTPAYMSPEQHAGREVSVQSDLYALGLVLYELFTGRRAFDAASREELARQRSEAAPTPPSALVDGLSPAVESIILRCLEKDPRARPASAQAVATALTERAVVEGSALKTFLAKDRSISRKLADPRLRPYRIGLLIVVFVALASGAYFLGPRSATIPPDQPENEVLVVLGEFENLTQDPLLDESLDLAFRVGLEQSRHISIMPEIQVEEALSRMQRDPTMPVDRDLGIEICQREAANALVIGSIVKIGTAYSVSAETIDPQTQRSLSTAQERAANQDGILAALERVVQDTRTDLGESIAAIEESTQSLERVTTRDLEALKLYSLGLKAGNTSEAIPLYEKALELDSEFAMAHVKLAIWYLALGKSEKVARHFDEALKYSERLTPFEKLYVEGWIANLRRTPEEMIRTWSLMATLYPKNQIGHNNLGMIYWLLNNQFAEAAEAFRGPLRHGVRNLSRESEHPLGYCELALDNYSEALTLFEKHQLVEAMADVYIAEERYSEALLQIERLSASSAAGDRLSMLLQKTILFADQGRFQKGIPLASEAAALAQQIDDRVALLSARMAQISFLAQGAAGSELQSALEQGIQQATELLRDKSAGGLLVPVPHLAILGKISARFSALSQAEAVHELIRDKAQDSGIPLWIGYTKTLEGEILAARRRLPEAIILFEEALESVEFLQGRESLARAYATQGDTERAIAEYSWLTKQRGRTFVECLGMCSIRVQNVVDWSLAHAHLGRLYERNGRLQEAADSYRRFTDRWGGGDRPPIWQETKERLEAISQKLALHP